MPKTIQILPRCYRIFIAGRPWIATMPMFAFHDKIKLIVRGPHPFQGSVTASGSQWFISDLEATYLVW